MYLCEFVTIPILYIDFCITTHQYYYIGTHQYYYIGTCKQQDNQYDTLIVVIWGSETKDEDTEDEDGLAQEKET
jgi:hypothetical protein